MNLRKIRDKSYSVPSVETKLAEEVRFKCASYPKWINIARGLSRVVHRFGIYICAPVCDVFTRECLAVVIGARIRGEHVASELNRLDYLRGKPETEFLR